MTLFNMTASSRARRTAPIAGTQRVTTRTQVTRDEIATLFADDLSHSKAIARFYG